MHHILTDWWKMVICPHWINWINDLSGVMWRWVFGPMSAITQVAYPTTLGGIFHHRHRPIDGAIGPAYSQTLILWRVSTSGSVITALIEKWGARLQGSVLKSIIWSLNPTGSSARPSWTDSRLITQCEPRLLHSEDRVSAFLGFGRVFYWTVCWSSFVTWTKTLDHENKGHLTFPTICHIHNKLVKIKAEQVLTGCSKVQTTKWLNPNSWTQHLSLWAADNLKDVFHLRAIH